VTGIVLDTNVVSETRRKRPDAGVLAWLDARPPELLFITATVLAELAAGVRTAPDARLAAKLRLWLEEMLLTFRGRVLPFDEAAALVYGEIVAAARARGKPPQVGDAQIAAVARCHGLAVATRDVDGFAHLGVEVVDPWQAG
jgi:toxin FitB